MGAYDPRIAQPGQTQVNMPNGFAVQPAPAMTNGFAQQGPMPQPNPARMPMPPQPNPMRQTVPQPGVPQGPMPGQPAPNPMLAGADMQQPGQPSMVDRLMSPTALIGMSLMANSGPSLQPINPMKGLGNALSSAANWQRTREADALAAETRRKEEIAAKRAADIAEEEWKWKKADRAAGQAAAGRTREFLEGIQPGLSDMPKEFQEKYIDDYLRGDTVTEETYDREKDLRTMIKPRREEYDAALNGYNKVRAAAADETGASDIALIFGYMKTLDPRSQVTDGEVATVQNAASIPARIRNLYNNALKGENLEEGQRRELTQAAAIQFNVQRQQYAEYQNWVRENLLAPYGDGIEENRVLRGLGEFIAPPNLSDEDVASIQFTPAGQ